MLADGYIERFRVKGVGLLGRHGNQSHLKRRHFVFRPVLRDHLDGAAVACYSNEWLNGGEKHAESGKYSHILAWTVRWLPRLDGQLQGTVAASREHLRALRRRLFRDARY